MQASYISYYDNINLNNIINFIYVYLNFSVTM